MASEGFGGDHLAPGYRQVLVAQTKLKIPRACSGSSHPSLKSEEVKKTKATKKSEKSEKVEEVVSSNKALALLFPLLQVGALLCQGSGLQILPQVSLW